MIFHSNKKTHNSLAEMGNVSSGCEHINSSSCKRINSSGLTKTGIKYCCQKCINYCSYDKAIELSIILLQWFVEYASVYEQLVVKRKCVVINIIQDLCKTFTNDYNIIIGVPHFISYICRNFYDSNNSIIPGKFIDLVSTYISTTFPKFNSYG